MKNPPKTGERGPRHRAQEAESKLRRDGRHCPVCAKALPRIAGKSGSARQCTSCGAKPQAAQRCTRCHEETVWLAASRAGCQACGLHGSAVRVVQGALEEERGRGDTRAPTRRSGSMRLDVYVNYRGTCEEAFRFYEEHLGGTITGIVRMPSVFTR